MIDFLRTAVMSPHIVDFALVIIAFEVVLLAQAAAARGRLSLSQLGGQVAAGVCLMLALRAVLAGSDPLWVGFFLALSFPAHLWDVRRRLTSSR
jgi:hypothetical protein